MDYLIDILNDLHSHNLTKVMNNDQYIEAINNMTIMYLDKDKQGIILNNMELDCIRCILEISNILYNNTDVTILPLDDGVYDLLLELYKKYRPAGVGAEPIQFEPTKTISEDQPLVDPFVFIDTNKIYNDFIFGEDIYPNRPLTATDLLVNPFIFTNRDITKRTLSISHDYPELVGTLDKCKFVLMSQAEAKGVANDMNVKVLERDFFQPHLQMGLIDFNNPFTIIAELKYDGISVEATVTNRVLAARTRGDAINDIAADITPILEGYMFPYIQGEPEPFGMKFEAIMTYENLYRYNQMRNKNYKNCRTAISSIFASSDGYKYRDFITLVPLATSLSGIDRISEIEFMNTYYYSGEALRYSIITGNYMNVLYQIKKFAEEAEYLRQYLPFMYDGIVLSYLDPTIRKTLGRVGAINKYSMAVKFTPLERYTKFRKYEFSVGQDGSITPMIYYDPVEFYGTIHYKSSGHSYERFKDLNLSPGDTLRIVYTNDVMPYVYKVESSGKEPIKFIETCPSCGSKIVISESGKSAYCLNINCPERVIKRLVGMMDKLNLNDFGESYIKALGVYSLTQMLNLDYEYIRDRIGNINALKFIDRMNAIKNEPIYDYKILGALGFTNIAQAKWKLILSTVSLDEIITLSPDELYNKLNNIKGIGPKVIVTIINERTYYMEDLNTISKLPNVISTTGTMNDDAIKVRFTGFRDKQFMKLLIDKGFDCSEGSVTNKTDVLLIPYEGFSSSKVNRVINNGYTKIMTKQQFIDTFNINESK